MIDINFDVYSDTPKGKDPDSFSPKLREYHKLLWSKKLPSGRMFNLSDNVPRKLYHKSDLGEFLISSDSIGHTYRSTKVMSRIVKQVPSNEMNDFFSLCSTIGAYIIFPANKVNNKMTINGSRGLNRNIRDRFDLTLECIRLFYLKESSPLYETLNRYVSFFRLFETFRGYVDFFLLQDLVNQSYNSVKFWIPFSEFGSNPLPENLSDYKVYMENISIFIKARNIRIKQSI